MDMTALERAQTYAAIFLGVGDRWAHYLPVDASLRRGVVYLQGVAMRPTDDGWELTENGSTWTVRRKGTPR